MSHHAAAPCPTSDLQVLLSTAPPANPVRALVHRWDRGALSCLPLAELSLLIALSVAVCLHLASATTLSGVSEREVAQHEIV